MKIKLPKNINTQFFPDKLIILISLYSIYATITYYIYSLNNFGFLTSITLTILTYIILENKLNLNNPNINSQTTSLISKITPKKPLLHVVFFTFVTFCVFILFDFRTTNSIVTPWNILPSYFIIIFACTSLITIILNQKKHHLASLSIFSFISFSIALITYKIGYGFDPFIHQAALKSIINFGIIEPKSPYYIGEYALEILTYKLTPLSISTINKLIVPSLASILIPVCLRNSLTNLKFKNKAILILCFLILPFNYLILTTPQSLAYIFTICTICYGINFSTNKNSKDLIIMTLLSISSLTIHPIAGIPALLFTFTLLANYKIKKLRKTLITIYYSLLTFSIPVLFHFLSTTLNTAPENNLAISNIFHLTTHPIFPYKEDIFLNFSYLWHNNIRIIVLALALSGLYISKRNNLKITPHFFLFSAGLFISFLISSTLNFDFLINYERDNYTNRLLLISCFFLIPYIATTFNFLVIKSNKQNTFVKTTLTILLSLIITTSLYLSYPRKDNYFNSRGYSTSQLDIEAVNWINHDANQKKYIVLANQQVSAASLKQFGFKTYHKSKTNEPIFYYPIPTGGPLYQYYLDMVYKKPSHETVNKAMELAGVNTAYFVLNKYWWAFDKIKNEAIINSSSHKILGNHDIYIFKYKK